ncbi:MAG: 16S rRNA (cytidine(1402)-2'-O)-methyltransferase [Firmicutes bacterium]|nr:16S rRNA (cytidine(1402)-2'-O)-methyltransferase [Bacillota bacterium]
MSQKSYDGSNSLYLIPTPIGNFEDMTLRSIETLKMVDVLFCEDTRITKQMLNRLEISKKLISSNDHNEESTKNLAIKYLEEGKNIGIVTDRGTPIISDPGYKVVEEVIKKGYNVIPLPGANALIPALISSGVNPSPFMFYGFLNAKKSKREKELENLKKYPVTIIFYEAPHRIIEMLESIRDIFGERRISVSREISKLYEEIYRGTVSEVIEELNSEEIRGEFVVVVEGSSNEVSFESMSVEEHVNMYIEEGLTEKDAMKKVAKDRNTTKSDIYKIYHTGK